MSLPKGYMSWSNERRLHYHATQGLPPMVKAALRQRRAQRVGKPSRHSFPRLSKQPDGRVSRPTLEA
jgi:hypothetical protein